MLRNLWKKERASRKSLVKLTLEEWEKVVKGEIKLDECPYKIEFVNNYVFLYFEYA